jgi:hypothetical protein
MRQFTRVGGAGVAEDQSKPRLESSNRWNETRVPRADFVQCRARRHGFRRRNTVAPEPRPPVAGEVAGGSGGSRGVGDPGAGDQPADHPHKDSGGQERQVGEELARVPRQDLVDAEDLMVDQPLDEVERPPDHREGAVEGGQTGRNSPHFGVKLGSKWPEIGGKSAENRPEMGQIGVENGADPGESCPSDGGRSSRNRRPSAERRLRTTPANDITHGRLNYGPTRGRTSGGRGRVD